MTTDNLQNATTEQEIIDIVVGQHECFKEQLKAITRCSSF